MNANIHYLHPQSGRIGHFIRLGHTGHRVLENLHAAGRLPIERAVVDAAHAAKQADLLSALRNSGVELALDTRAAELATIGGATGRAKQLPWAWKGRPHRIEDFDNHYLNEFAHQVAAFAVGHGFHTLLASTHALSGPRDPWLLIDIRTCEALRHALDTEGGKDIQLEYPLLLPYQSLRDGASRRAFIKELGDLPFENLWLRVSGFGSTATPAGVRRYINAAWDFHAIDKPLVADGVGGLVGLALPAFGAVGAIAHGIAETERFNAREWKRPRRDGGSGNARVYFDRLDLYFVAEQARQLLARRGAKSLLACTDAKCCPLGVESMLETSKVHFINQRNRQIEELNQVPEARRADHFINRQLETASLTARKAKRMRLPDPKIMAKLKERSRRLDQMREVLVDLHYTTEEKPKALKPIVPHMRLPTIMSGGRGR